jgi:O-methyltransferase
VGAPVDSERDQESAVRDRFHFDRLVGFAERVRYMGLPEPIRTVRRHSLLSYVNLFFLQELARRLETTGIPGDFVECGVYRGGSAGVLAYWAVRSRFDRKIWLYDAFAGMPPACPEKDDDHSRSIEGQFVGSETQTRRILQRLGIPNSRYFIGTGWFDRTLPSSPVKSVSLLHVDCDFYEPVKLVLETFYERVMPGGYVVLNDYGSFEGCRNATNEFLAKIGYAGKPIQVDMDAYYFQTPAV